jgi:hypothetical protein
MAKGDHEFKKRAAGSTNGGYARARVQIGFPPEQVAAIGRLAEIHNRSFAAEVRALVDYGFGGSERTRRLADALNTIAEKEPDMCVFGDPSALPADEANRLLDQIFTIVRVATAPRESTPADDVTP